MRKLSALLAMAVAAGASTGWAGVLGLDNITADGSIEVLGQQTNNEADFSTANDHRGNTLTRVRVGLSADVTEDVKAHVEAVRNGDTTGGSNQYGSTARPTSANNELTNFRFQNAYLDLENFLSLDAVRLGRQYLGRDNDAIAFFGVLPDDALSVLALDALSVSKKWGQVNVWAVTGKARENDTIPGTGAATDAGDAAPGDMNVSWVTFSSDELVPVSVGKLPLEIGYYVGNQANTDLANDDMSLVVYDLRAGWTGLLDGRLDLGVEYAFNGGQDNNSGSKLAYKVNPILVNANLKDAANVWAAHAKFASASGDDNGADSQNKDFYAIAGDYRFGEILSNTLGLTLDSLVQGVNVINVGGSYVLPVMDQKVTVLADVFSAKMNKVAAGADKKLGTEFDLALSYKHSETVNASVGYAMLQTGEGLAGFTDPEDVTKAYAKLNVKFGGR